MDNDGFRLRRCAVAQVTRILTMKEQNNELVEPPEGVIAGEDVPRENEEDEQERVYRKAKEIRTRRLEIEESQE